MPQVIDIPGIGLSEFPDGISDADIVASIKKTQARQRTNELALRPSPKPDIGQPFAEVQPGGKVIQRMPGNDPERNRAEFQKGINMPGQVAEATIGDIAAGMRGSPEFSGNLPAAVKGEPLPMDTALRDAALESKFRGEAPTAAITGRIAEGLAGTAPMLPLLGALPAAAQKALLLGFTAKMVKDTPEIAKQLGDEFGKPPEQRDPDKIAQLVSSAIQTVGFTAASGVGLKRGLTTPKPLATIGEQLAAKGQELPPVEPPKTPVAPSEAVKPSEPVPSVKTPVAASQSEIHGIRPAIRTMDGKVVVGDKGDVHNDIIAKNDLKAEDIDRRLFVDAQGKEISREELAKMGVPEAHPVPGAHAPELAKVQEQQSKKPNPKWQVTVQSDNEVPGSGYVQIDDVSGGQNNWSKSSQTLAKEGYDVPDFSKLPQGKYTFKQAVTKLKEINKAAQGSTVQPPQSSAAPNLVSSETVPPTREPVNVEIAPKQSREQQIARLKEIRAQVEPLANKGGLTSTESERFKELNAEANSIRFDLQKPLDVTKIGTPQSRRSTLPNEVVAIARDDLMREKDVYTPIIESAIGVSHNADTAVDDVMNGRNVKVSPQRLYDAFNHTREALRKQFGDTMQLFRATGKQRAKATQNWATTREYAKQFGENVVSKQVPVDDIIAVNVGPSGKYHEIIVGREPVAPKVTPKVTENQPGNVPQLQGLGGALEGEVEPTPTTPTGIKNATVEKERAARGLPPAIQPARRSFGRVWDETMAKIDQDPRAQDELIDELKKKPRAVTDSEDAMLLQRQIDLQNEYGKLTREMAQAYDDAKEFPERMDAVAALKPRIAQLSDELLDLYNINKRVGTETGRGLNARKMMANEDYSLAAMETKLRAAQGGKPLTPKQASEIKNVAEGVDKAQKEIEEFQKRVAGKETTEPAIPDAEKKALDAANKTVREAAAKLAAEEDKARVAENVRQQEIEKLQSQAKQRAAAAANKTVTSAATRAATDEGVRRVKQAGRDKQVAKIQVDYAKKALARAQKTVREAAARMAKAENDARLKAAADKLKASKNPRLQALKTRYANRFEELIKKMAGHDYNAPGKKPLVLDPEATRLKANYENAKLQFDRLAMKERLRQRPLREKVQDTFVKWRRAFLLSSPVTLAKLTSAAIERGIITPSEELVGGVYSKVPGLSRIAERAPREGGMSVKAEAKSIASGFTKGMSDAWQTLRTGKSDLDTLFGKRDVMPREMIDFIGSIHGALKAPVKRAEFARSFEKRVEFAIRNGQDATDPLVQTKIALEAFKDAQRSIFMQDNRVSSAYNAAIGRLEQPNKGTGKVPIGSKALASTARVLLPIVKVPTNIVAETLQYAFGTVTGSTRAALALRRGVETLKPEEADLIMRDLKKGSLGAALLTLGYLSPNLIGGYYQPNDKKQKGHPQFGTVKIGDTQIPTYLIHNPLLEMLQVGATVRHVADSKLRKKDTVTQGAAAGALVAVLGVASEVPFVREQEELVKLFNPYERQQYFNQFAKDLVVPLGVSWVAQHFDKDAQGNYVPRDPKTIWQSIETGISGLREKVGVNAKKERQLNRTPWTPPWITNTNQ